LAFIIRKFFNLTAFLEAHVGSRVNLTSATLFIPQPGVSCNWTPTTG